MKEQSISYLLGKGCPILQQMKNRKTAAQYAHITARFAAWLADQRIKRPSQLEAVYGTYKAAIQAYSDYLGDQGKAASTVHTYAAACCVAAGVPLQEIRKSKRITSNNIRSREGTEKNIRAEQEEASGYYNKLIVFQKMVGIRRAELADLKKNDLVPDESGHLCVRVRKGKGGKLQLQRILPIHEDYVSSYFDKTEDNVFPRKLMNNHLDLHALRAKHAQACYKYYESMTGEDRERLKAELIARYKAWNRKPEGADQWLKNNSETNGGRYCLRGGNRRLAIKHGLPVDYDRLALLAVSVFHLSHWRLDVTVCNYMLNC